MGLLVCMMALRAVMASDGGGRPRMVTLSEMAC